MFKTAVLELNQPAGAVMFNLTAFGAGPHAILDRICEGQSGIYAWFRAFQFRDSSEDFGHDLLSAIRAPKFQSRKGYLAPYYEVSLHSRSYMPEGKERSLKEALKDETFLSAMKFALEWAILFQAPLYVGKSANLRERVGQHLEDGSDLRLRLAEADINIESTYLLLVPTPTRNVNTSGEQDVPQEASDAAPISYEVLFEEVFSRLFNPSFTIRLG